MKINDVLKSNIPSYPDHRVVAIVDNAVALERMDNVLEPLTWYSKEYVKRLLDNDWEVINE